MIFFFLNPETNCVSTPINCSLTFRPRALVKIVTFSRSVPRQECHQVPYQECRDVPRRVCASVPRNKCQHFPRQDCVSVPRQHCRNVPNKQCKTVPKEACAQKCENAYWCKVCH